MYDVKFQFFIGDTYARDIIIKKYSSEISEMYFTVKKSNNDKNYVLQKTLDDGITLTDVVYDDGKIIERTYNLLVNATDTDDLTPNKEYVFDIEIVTPVLSGEDIKKTIITGTLTLTDATTRVFNEGV